MTTKKQSKMERVKYWLGLKSGEAKAADTKAFNEGVEAVMEKKMNRRKALQQLTLGVTTASAVVQTACQPFASDQASEKANLNWEEYFKKNYRLMTAEERLQTVSRLERIGQLKAGVNQSISTESPSKGVLFGYAFNISKCKGYMDCISACVKENNLDRSSHMQYIRIFEVEEGQSSLASANGSFYHEVPAEGHYYMGTQCFHCENPPCVDVCPVGATWKEDDGIVVVDYDWCIGCRYCQAACPYFGRRFNWNTPEVPIEEMNLEQHYLGNRPRKKGVMEKCTFCIQRSRKGKNPACVEACPTGARVFGNLLDPDSEIRYVIENKKVFRMKEDLGTEPKFWYFTD